MQNGSDNHNEKGVFLTHEEYNMYKQILARDSERESKILYLEQELAQLKRMIFGSKSERFVQENPGQLSLGLDIPQQEVPEAETEDLSYTRKKPTKEKESPVRLALPSHLHRQEHVIEPVVDVTGAKKIGEVVTEILEYTPGKFYVVKYVRPKYALPKEGGIVIGDLPSLPIPKGNAGPGVLAHMAVSKYVDHCPFHRQAKQFKRQDMIIAESTMNGWFTALCRLLEPLYDKLTSQVRQCSYLMADETPIPVLTKDKPGATHKGFFWVYYSPIERRVCFDYRQGRGRG